MPLAYASATTLPATLLFMNLTQVHLWQTNFSEPLWPSSLLLSGGLLYLLLHLAGSKRFTEPWIMLALVVTVLLGIFTTPGILVAIALLVTGMFLLIARRNAIAMVIGYIMMENGIYLVGTGFSVRAHHIVEFGILLDVLAGVMIMAIILQNINQAFDDVDTALLRTLKE